MRCPYLRHDASLHPLTVRPFGCDGINLIDKHLHGEGEGVEERREERGEERSGTENPGTIGLGKERDTIM